MGTPEDVTKAKEASHGLGLFVRSLVGFDREAAKNAMNAFLKGRTPTPQSSSIFGRDCKPPHRQGPEIDELLSVLEEVRSRAIA